MYTDAVSVRQADVRDVSAIAPLFDAYRQFYGKPADLALAERFLGHRLRNGDSLILVAEVAGSAVGFTQLYPTFSSLQCSRAWILNDLFVAERARRSGVAEMLMTAASDAARRAGVRSISLSTAHDNAVAQALYVKLGYALDLEFRTYSLSIAAEAV